MLKRNLVKNNVAPRPRISEREATTHHLQQHATCTTRINIDGDITRDTCINTVPLQAGTIILKTSVAHLWRGRPLDLRVNQLLG